MAKFVKGDVVVVPFPFSDLSASKRRPALVIADLAGDDAILYQIASQNVRDFYALSLTTHDFENGQLDKVSNIRPNRIFTADKNIIAYKIGKINREKLNKIYSVINQLFQDSD